MNEIAIKENGSTAVIVAEDFKAIATEWLTSTGNLQKFTEQEKAQFIDICAAYKLNPIKKEVYGIKYGNNFNLIVGYESYIKRAERSGRLDGWSAEVIGNGSNMKAVVTIYRKDWNKPFIHEVYFEEYSTGQNLWKTKPRTMLKKVAIAQGFRMCFSEELGGIPYTSEELSEKLEQEKETELKNISPVEQIEIKPAPAPKKKAPFTKEQGLKLASVLNAVYDDNTPIFNEEDKEPYRIMLSNGEFEKALEMAQAELTARTTAPTDEGTTIEIPEDIF